MEAIREHVRKKYTAAITEAQSCCGPDLAGSLYQSSELDVDYHLRPANPDDLAAIEGLLLASGLPTAGVADHLSTFIVADAAGVVGVIGREQAGQNTLLRSLAVAGDWRKRGLGSALTTQALTDARQAGATSAYLLTNTAEHFAAHRGFAPIGRDGIPTSLLQPSALAKACPDCSTCMYKAL